MSTARTSVFALRLFTILTFFTDPAIAATAPPSTPECKIDDSVLRQDISDAESKYGHGPKADEEGLRSYLSYLSGCGSLLGANGNFAEAERVYQFAIALGTQKLGAGDEDVARVRTGYAMILMSSDDPAKKKFGTQMFMSEQRDQGKKILATPLPGIDHKLGETEYQEQYDKLYQRAMLTLGEGNMASAVEASQEFANFTLAQKGEFSSDYVNSLVTLMMPLLAMGRIEETAAICKRSAIILNKIGKTTEYATKFQLCSIYAP